ncbi:hypothetical protein N7462_007644 [Penicillium macrosclerotiorum]|uniref:uncharacterized protein n=1 Tax=Penicillium macrosclerotiorum TaxID=303699 RepID=UPI002547BA42|nr:uncharacterized protein N7462_007644 [Penicillium macrosclerotiorum]KAJ5679400.1 hypothetical protein N7462_007644 [Penicillium macrosclerotiorum]
MIQERLNDAAISLHRVLRRNKVSFGIFGGYAIGVLGGTRESKDIDCLASASKEQIISMMDKKDGFVLIPQCRQDYVAFFWCGNPPEDRYPVLVEIFCERFPGSQHTMKCIKTGEHILSGQQFGKGISCFFDPFHLFKGKLRAAATRSKSHDAEDLCWLADRFGTTLKERSSELNLEYLRVAMERYPELEKMFRELNVDLASVRNASDSLELPCPSTLTPEATLALEYTMAPGDVQFGLLG